jgi:hypothetical protein
MGRPAGSQKSTVRLKIEIEFGRMSNFTINDRPSRAVSTLVRVAFRLREESITISMPGRTWFNTQTGDIPNVMALSDDDNGDLGVHIQVRASL